MPRDRVEPFSRAAWEEKRRRWALEQERIRRGRIRMLAAFGSLVVIVVLVWVYYVTPSDWKNEAGRFARKLASIAESLADR